MDHKLDEMDAEVKDMALQEAKEAARKAEKQKQREQVREESTKELHTGCVAAIYIAAAALLLIMCAKIAILSWITMAVLVLIVLIMLAVLIVKRRNAPFSVQYRLETDDPDAPQRLRRLQDVKEQTGGIFYTFIGPTFGLLGFGGLGFWLYFSSLSNLQAQPYSYDTSAACLAFVAMAFLICCPLYMIGLGLRIKAINEYEELDRRVKEGNGILRKEAPKPPEQDKEQEQPKDPAEQGWHADDCGNE